MSFVFLWFSWLLGLGAWFGFSPRSANTTRKVLVPIEPVVVVAVKPGARYAKLVEWVGAGTGLLGSALLASNSAYSGYGFIAFLVSNGFWLWFGIRTGTWGMVAMQVGFSITSVIGIYRWLG